MKVKDLIKKLQRIDPELNVIYASSCEILAVDHVLIETTEEVLCRHDTEIFEVDLSTDNEFVVLS